MQNSQKIRILLTSFDYPSLEKGVVDILSVLKRAGADISGPFPLPTRIEKFTVNRSPHVNKKSREQFEIRTHKRLITINYTTPQAVEALKKVHLPAGVDVQIKLMSVA